MEVFRSVIIGGSITNAAKLLNVSQPAVSRIVAHTESSLGIELFTRSKGRLVPTTEALLLLEQVDKVHSAAVQANRFVENMAREISGTLRIGVSACLSTIVTHSLIAPFMRTYPRIKVDFASMLLSDMPTALLSDGIDLAVSVLPLTHANITSTPISTGRMALLVPKTHSLEGRETVHLSDISEFPMVSHSGSIAFGKMIDDAFKAAGLPYESCCVIHHSRDACDLVAANVGVAIVDPYTAASIQRNDLVVVPIRERIETRPSINHMTLREPRTEITYLMKMGRQVLAEALPS